MRNPRLNPEMRDVLQHDSFDYREVYSIQKYVANVVVYWRRSSFRKGHCSLPSWRKWAKDAEVVTVGGVK